MFGHNLYRFGSFEIFKTRDMLTGRMGPSVGLKDLLFQLVDYVTETFYPEVLMYTNSEAIYKLGTLSR